MDYIMVILCCSTLAKMGLHFPESPSYAALSDTFSGRQICMGLEAQSKTTGQACWLVQGLQYHCSLDTTLLTTGSPYR